LGAAGATGAGAAVGLVSGVSEGSGDGVASGVSLGSGESFGSVLGAAVGAVPATRVLVAARAVVAPPRMITAPATVAAVRNRRVMCAYNWVMDLLLMNGDPLAKHRRRRRANGRSSAGHGAVAASVTGLFWDAAAAWPGYTIRHD
jgi:hypothetical protein